MSHKYSVSYRVCWVDNKPIGHSRFYKALSKLCGRDFALRMTHMVKVGDIPED
jgi:hypothetical protein